MRTTTCVAPISSMRPQCPSTTTTSSMRIGCTRAICRPAIRLDSTGLAASAATRPATPADASRLVPRCRAAGQVIRIAASAATQTAVSATRASTRTCVWILRASRLSVAFRQCAAATRVCSASIARVRTHAVPAMAMTRARCCRGAASSAVSGIRHAIRAASAGSTQRSGGPSTCAASGPGVVSGMRRRMATSAVAAPQTSIAATGGSNQPSQVGASSVDIMPPGPCCPAPAPAGSTAPRRSRATTP